MDALEVLKNVVDKGERLVDVFYALFDSDASFITAIELRFESSSVVFRAVADDDTIQVSSGEINLKSEESLIEAKNLEPWISSEASYLVWGWQMTNQQGYDDGVRIEFSNQERKFALVVEFIVIASAIHIFSSTRIEAVNSE